MTTVSVLSTPSAAAPFEQTTVERREVGPSDVRIDVAYCGICHSDIHQAREEWGKAIFPMVPGHEVAGTVAEVGAEVTTFAVGDHVGIGCFVDSCRECENCVAGEEQHCLKGMVATYNGKFPDGEPTYGGYSTGVVVDEAYALKIPDGMDLSVAAPLLCAGITTYSPLRHWGAGPGKKVAIVGLGGLGHLGVQLAHAMGAEVTVLSQSLKKQEDGLRLGADHYYATDDTTFKQLRNTFDLIINTVSADLPFRKFLGMLRLDGAMVNVGIPSEPAQVPVGALIGMRRSFTGSNIGGIKETQEMLDFCAEHGIGAEVEVLAPEPATIDEAYERVVASDVRYRFVIDMGALG